MRKLNQILTLIAIAVVFTGCSFGDSPIAERNQSFVTGAQSEFEAEKGECTHFGTVRKVSGQLSCDFLIILEDGTLVTPTNVEELPFDLENRQQVYFGFTEQAAGSRGCLEALYVSINCITRVNRDVESASHTRQTTD